MLLETLPLSVATGGVVNPLWTGLATKFPALAGKIAPIVNNALTFGVQGALEPDQPGKQAVSGALTGGALGALSPCGRAARLLTAAGIGAGQTFFENPQAVFRDYLRNITLMATFAGLGAAHGLRAQEATAGTLFDWARSNGFAPAEIASSLRSYGIRPFGNSFALEMGPDIVVDPRFRTESEEFKGPSRPESQVAQEAETAEGALNTGSGEMITPQDVLDFTENSIDSSKSAASAPAPEGKGAYEDVKGHHIFAKSGFREHVAYDPRKGFSISQEFIKNRDWDHPKMTSGPA